MDSASLLALTHNAALLLAMIFIYDLAIDRKRTQRVLGWKVLIGVGLGITAIVIMLTPWEFAPGIVFDTRSVLLGIAGLFFGPLPTLIAMVMAAALRLYQGGAAAVTGVLVIIASGCIGIAWRHFRFRELVRISTGELYLFGLVVHLAMLVLMFTLPLTTALQVLADVGLPVLIVYPLATTLLGTLFAGRLERKQVIEALAENEFLFRSQFDFGNIGIAITSVDKHWLRVNPRLCEMIGYNEEELSKLTWADITHPDDLNKDVEQFQRILTGEIESYDLDKRFICKDGKVLYVHLTASCYRNEGQVQFFIAGLLDTTQQKLAELALRASEEQLTLVLAGGELGFWDWDIVTNKVERNARWAEMLGYTHEEIQRTVKQWIDFIHPDDRALAWESITRHLEGKTPQHKVEYRMQTKQGDYRWIQDCAKVVSYTSDGKPLRMCGTHTDITERKQAEESMQLASMVYDNSSEAMMVMDANTGNVITINPAFTELTQYPPEEIIGQYAGILSTDSERSTLYTNLRESMKNNGRWRGETWCRRKNGEDFAIWLTMNTIFNSEGKPYRRVALFSDITDKKQSEEIIWNQANFDQLTQLPNRRMFLDHLEQEIKKSARTHQPLALLFLDLDLFKEVNDTLGHDMGDKLLKETAERLRQCVRDTDTVARLGGDEFTVILSDLDSTESVERIAETILRKLTEPFQLGADTAYISTSIGITLYPNDARAIDTLLKNADQAMYAAKSLGRNRFNYFTASMQEAARNRMRMINDMRSAISDAQFMLHYQPIIDLRNNSISKAEALIRWQHPTRGLVSPNEFISLAEDTGMIIDIGDWVFREAMSQVARWRDWHNIDIQISVNKSPVQFRDENNDLSHWFEHIRQLGLSGNSINIEITEGLLLDANNAVHEKLLAFRDAGIQVSLDDFGTGYSSLAYLKKFDIDYLKIDQSFVRNLHSDAEEFALCEAIIVMAHKLGIKVIAEGVETQQQCDLLAAAGCDYAQGYLFSKPVPADDFARLFLVQ
jgi:diguanylate cyclase (GGDEF)-like protein/PAS domain S-box-containing protein